MEMDGLMQVLVISMFTALARSEGCSMVQDFDAEIVFNQSSQLPPPLKQLNVKNNKICNSKCCASHGCNVAYFDGNESSNYSCKLYSCHPLSGCGFLHQKGVQVSVNEVNLPANSSDITPIIAKQSDTDQITIQTFSYQTPLPHMNTEGTTNASHSSTQIPALITKVSNDTLSKSNEKSTPETADILQSSIQISTVSNVSASEFETNANGAGNIVPQTPLQISTPLATENDTLASHTDIDGLVSTFFLPVSSTLVNQVTPTQTLTSSVSENINNSIIIPVNLEGNLYNINITNNNYIQQSKSTDQSVSETVSFTLSSSKATSTQTSHNAGSLLTSLISTLPSTTVENSNGSDSHNTPMLTVMPDSPKELITNSNGSSDQIKSTSTTYQPASDHQAEASMLLPTSSSLLSFDASKYSGNILTLEESVNIVPTRSGNVMTSPSFVTEVSYSNGTEASSSLSGMPSVVKTLLLCSLAFGCIFILVVVGVLGKLVFDSYRKRHYSRLDYLINGMY